MISIHGRLKLKKTTDWFAAGEGFLKAMEILSDGAFKLFVFVCLKADRHTATCHASLVQLAHALRKPCVAIEGSVAELRAKGVCSISSSNLECMFRVEDAFWPYYNSGHASTNQCATGYVAAIRELFLSLGCTSGRFGTSEEAQAKKLEKRGLPLDIVRDAMIMGACRKYVSWLNNGYSEPISSVAYSESVIEEFLRCPPSTGYREHLSFELTRLASHWSRSVETKQKQIPGPQGDQRQEQSCGEIRDDVEAAL